MSEKYQLDLPEMKQIQSDIQSDIFNLKFFKFSSVRILEIKADEVQSPEDHGQYLETLRLFTQVTALSIKSWKFQRFESSHITEFLGHFGATVTALRLHKCSLDSEVLILLASLFPLVGDLRIDEPLSGGETYKIQRADRPSDVRFQGKLSLRGFGTLHEEFFKFIKEHYLDLQMISVFGCENSGGELQQLFNRPDNKFTLVGIQILRGQGEFIPVITVHQPVAILTEWFSDLISLGSCTELRILVIFFADEFGPDDPNWDVLGTIASPHLEEIAIRIHRGETAWGSPEDWEEVDNCFCELYERKELCVNLHPSYSDQETDPNLLVGYIQKFWPRFLKKGTTYICDQTLTEPRDKKKI